MNEFFPPSSEQASLLASCSNLPSYLLPTSPSCWIISFIPAYSPFLCSCHEISWVCPICGLFILWICCEKRNLGGFEFLYVSIY